MEYGFPVLATYGQRVAGFLIDVGLPTGLFAMALIAALRTRDWTVVLVVHPLATSAVVAFLVWNCGWRQGRSGQSIGKRALGMRLVAVATGQPVGFGRAVGRQFAHLLDGLPLWLGYVWPLWDEQRQTFADKVCSTLVVQAEVRSPDRT
jgi:uncharacterized RDD family membrane protein YckC